MINLFGRIGSFWRERWGGEAPRTYDAACEELGGVPWRIKPDATDTWFVHRADEAEEARPPTLDALQPPLMDSTWRIRREVGWGKLTLAGGAVVGLIGCAIAIAHASSSPSLPAPVAALTPTLAAPAAPPPSIAPRVPATPALLSPASRSPSVPIGRQAASPKLAALVRTAPPRGIAGAYAAPAASAKPHLRALPAKRPLAARARRR